MKIPRIYLEHRITRRPIAKYGSSIGETYETDIPNVPALVVEKQTKAVDQRPNSQTRGDEILCSAQIVCALSEWMPPDSLIILWPGEPRERLVTVVAAGYNKHTRAPESAQFWVI